MTAESTIATIRGGVGTSIDILMDGLQQVGDIISFNNITSLIPSGEDCTRFFFKCLDFCKTNGATRLFRVDQISEEGKKYEIMVSPIYA